MRTSPDLTEDLRRGRTSALKRLQPGEDERRALLEAIRNPSEHTDRVGHPLFYAKASRLAALRAESLVALLPSAPLPVSSLVLSTLSHLAAWGDTLARAALLEYVREGCYWELALNALCQNDVEGLESLEEVVAMRLEEECSCPPLDIPRSALLSKEEASSPEASPLGFGLASSAARALWKSSPEDARCWALRFKSEKGDRGALARSILLAHAEPEDEEFLLGVLRETLSRNTYTWFDCADALARCQDLAISVPDAMTLKVWELSDYPCARAFAIEASSPALRTFLTLESLEDADMMVRETALALLPLPRYERELRAVFSDLREPERLRSLAARRLSQEDPGS